MAVIWDHIKYRNCYRAEAAVNQVLRLCNVSVHLATTEVEADIARYTYHRHTFCHSHYYPGRCVHLQNLFFCIEFKFNVSVSILGSIYLYKNDEIKDKFSRLIIIRITHITKKKLP